jgi:hypothetical protein
MLKARIYVCTYIYVHTRREMCPISLQPSHFKYFYFYFTHTYVALLTNEILGYK